MRRFYRGDPQYLSTPRLRMSRFLFALPVLLFSYLFFSGENGFFEMRERDQQLAEFRSEIERIGAENGRLEEELELLRSDLKTIERIARERYGMVKKNETVYMVYPARPENKHDRQD